MTKGIWQSFGLDLVYISVDAKFYQKISHSSRVGGSFIFFKILTSAKPGPVRNDISQVLGLELVNIVCMQKQKKKKKEKRKNPHG